MVDHLLLVSLFQPGLDPNPHIFSYVARAAERLLGPTHVETTYLSEARREIHRCDAVLLVGSALDRRLVPLSSECRKNRRPLVFWATDDPYEIDLNLEHLDLIDLIWTNDRASLMVYPKDKSDHLPLAADPDEHIRSTLTNDSEYWYDASFVGVEFPNRRSIIEELAPTLRRLKSAVIGPNWSIDESYVMRRRVSNREAANIANHSRVVLNLARRHNLANALGIIASTPGPRTFETGGCGTVQIASPEIPEIEEYYAVSAELELAATLSEMKTMIEELVHDSTRRKKTADAAREKTKRSHLYDHRVAKILSTLDKMTAG